MERIVSLFLNAFSILETIPQKILKTFKFKVYPKKHEFQFTRKLSNIMKINRNKKILV